MTFDRAFAAAGVLLVAALWSAAAGAQQVFRIVGPDGRITFSDRAPEDPKAKAAPANVVSMGGGTPTASLPFEVRNAANTYPVTLYTTANCAPCVEARLFLAHRGIPYAEKTVSTREDNEALQRMSGSQSLPFATIGAQQLKGFSESEWAQFLDAAGYPKTSQLPASYRNPEPAPLVVVQAPAAQGARGAASRPQRAAAPVQTPTPVARPTDNPAGIQF